MQQKSGRNLYFLMGIRSIILYAVKKCKKMKNKSQNSNFVVVILRFII